MTFQKELIGTIHWIVEKAREFHKKIYFCFIDYTKAFDCVDHNKLWKFLKEMGIPDHFTFLLRNLHACQEATVRTGHGTMCVCVLSRSVVSDSCDPIDCSLPGSSVRGILQARILEWVAISFCRGSFRPRNRTWGSCIAGRLFTDWAMRKDHGTMDWFKIGKGVCQGYILLPCLFNLHAEYLIWNAGLDEEQTGIRIAGRNISNLRYADDTMLTAESEEELKSLLMKVKEESEKGGLKLNIQKIKSCHLVPSFHGK